MAPTFCTNLCFYCNLWVYWNKFCRFDGVTNRFIYTKQISYLTIFNTVLLKNLLSTLSKLRDIIILQELDNNLFTRWNAFHRITAKLGHRYFHNIIYKIVVVILFSLKLFIYWLEWITSKDIYIYLYIYWCKKVKFCNKFSSFFLKRRNKQQFYQSWYHFLLNKERFY